MRQGQLEQSEDEGKGKRSRGALGVGTRTLEVAQQHCGMLSGPRFHYLDSQDLDKAV